MQNHLEISSKTQFWTRNVRNWCKSLTESLRNLQDLSRRTHKGPYGPIYGPIRAIMGPYGPQPGLGPNHPAQVSTGPFWGHMGPYEPIWSHMGPYGPAWTRPGPRSTRNNFGNLHFFEKKSKQPCVNLPSVSTRKTPHSTADRIV